MYVSDGLMTKTKYYFVVPLSSEVMQSVWSCLIDKASMQQLTMKPLKKPHSRATLRIKNAHPSSKWSSSSGTSSSSTFSSLPQSRRPAAASDDKIATTALINLFYIIDNDHRNRVFDYFVATAKTIGWLKIRMLALQRTIQVNWSNFSFTAEERMCLSCCRGIPNRSVWRY